MSVADITLNLEAVGVTLAATPGPDINLTVGTGATGPAGPAGPGVPVGGTEGQVLAKASATDYDTAWLTVGAAALLDVGTTAGTVAAGDDSRFTDARTPTGTAGGVLAGTYPNPTFAADMATQAELDAKAALTGAALTGPYAWTLAAATDAITTAVTADTNPRYVVNADGKQEWGPGNGALDTNLYRSAANELKTDDALVVGGSFLAIGTTPATTGAIRLPNDTGIYARGSGGTADVPLIYFTSTNQVILGASGRNISFPGGITVGDLKNITFGNSQDTNLYRSAANTLKTDDDLVVGGASFSVGTNPATTGALRIGNNTGLYARDAANTTDVPLVTFTSADQITLGAAGRDVSIPGGLIVGDSKNITFGPTVGTKIGSSTSQKLALWNATPDVQPTTAIAAATFAANTSGISDDTATFGGYTIGQIVAALQRIGALA